MKLSDYEYHLRKRGFGTNLYYDTLFVAHRVGGVMVLAIRIKRDRYELVLLQNRSVFDFNRLTIDMIIDIMGDAR